MVENVSAETQTRRKKRFLYTVLLNGASDRHKCAFFKKRDKDCPAAGAATGQAVLESRVIRNAHIARVAGTIKPIHDASIGTATSSIWIDKPFTILNKCTKATNEKSTPDATQ